MPSRCICNGHQDPECKRHGSVARERDRSHKRDVWATRGKDMADQQRKYRHETGRQRSATVDGGRRSRSTINRLEEMVHRPEDWKTHGACVAIYPDPAQRVAVFYPEKRDSAKKAKAICAGCPVREACLEYALVARERHGVWGGLGEQARRRYTQREDVA